jgi:hypothetical protein
LIVSLTLVKVREPTLEVPMKNRRRLSLLDYTLTLLVDVGICLESCHVEGVSVMIQLVKFGMRTVCVRDCESEREGGRERERDKEEGPQNNILSHWPSLYTLWDIAKAPLDLDTRRKRATEFLAQDGTNVRAMVWPNQIIRPGTSDIGRGSLALQQVPSNHPLPAWLKMPEVSFGPKG